MRQALRTFTEISKRCAYSRRARRFRRLSGVHGARDPGIGFEADWLIRRDCWKRGYATEAATAVIRRFFDRTQADSVGAVARADNLASIALMRKLGMRFVRSLERYGFDSVHYAVTRSDFRDQISRTQALGSDFK